MHTIPLVLVANQRPLINIDATLFINIGLWLLLFIVLRPLLWTPMLKLISAREAGTSGSRDSARELEHDARAKEAEYLAAQRTARTNAAAEREKLRNDALKRESEILAQARGRMTAAVESQRAEIKKQRELLRGQIKAQVPALATDIATKVLGREVRV